MTTERLRAELLLILSPVRERRIWRCLSRDDNERKAGPLFLARQRSFAAKRTKAGCRFVRSTSGILCGSSHPWLSRPAGLQLPALIDAAEPRRLPDIQKMGLTGLEPVTLRLSSACSNQLSYRPRPNLAI